MATSVTLNNVTYQIPAEGDFNWGTELSNYFIAISTSVLQKTGGTFTLTSEVNFGATYGVKSAYLKSQAANPASAGIIRLGNAENISWRNQANNGDLALTVNASNQLAYNGTKVILSGAIVNADVDAAAAIAYSKLNLTGSIVNADVSASAAIAVSKLAAVTASRLLVSDASGFLSASSVTSTEAGYLSGVTSAIQTQIDSKAPSASPTFTGTVTLPATVTGASAQVITLPTSTSTLATIGLAETFTGAKTFNDNGFTLQDNSDNTKKAVFELSGITTGQTRTLTVPNESGTLITAATVTTKGDLIAATGSGAISRLAAGTNNHALIADSAQATGLKYANIGVEKNILTATSSTKTPTASNNYNQMTNNSVTLTSGTWELVAGMTNADSGGASGISFALVSIYGANGADNTTPPTLLSATSNLTVDSAFPTDGILYSMGVSSTTIRMHNAARAIVTVTANVTVYAVPLVTATTPANARLVTYLTARKIY